MNTKSASIIGVSLIVAALIISLTPKKRSGLEVGRFQMGGVPGHAYVIDTVTGRVWEKYATTHQGSTSSDFNTPKIK